jgi:hypothetical protein
VDAVCPTCGWQKIDAFVTVGEADSYPECGTCGGGVRTVRLFLPQSVAHMHGDECDVTVRHGLCHEDGSPRRFTSKSEMRRVAAQLGYTNHVTHVPSRGSDKAKHTQRFV